MFKKENGITLVALVVTIIVLLILAGVSISMIAGENGIATRATDAAKKTDLGAIQETVEMAVSTAKADYMIAYAEGSHDEGMTAEDINKELMKEGYILNVVYFDSEEVENEDGTTEEKALAKKIYKDEDDAADSYLVIEMVEGMSYPKKDGEEEFGKPVGDTSKAKYLVTFTADGYDISGVTVTAK